MLTMIVYCYSNVPFIIITAILKVNDQPGNINQRSHKRSR
jgi:hypothetical protein